MFHHSTFDFKSCATFLKTPFNLFLQTIHYTYLPRFLFLTLQIPTFTQSLEMSFMYHPLNLFPTQAPDPQKASKLSKPTEPAPDRSISTDSLHGDMDKVEEPQIK